MIKADKVDFVSKICQGKPEKGAIVRSKFRIS